MARVHCHGEADYAELFASRHADAKCKQFSSIASVNSTTGRLIRHQANTRQLRCHSLVPEARQLCTCWQRHGTAVRCPKGGLGGTVYIGSQTPSDRRYPTRQVQPSASVQAISGDGEQLQCSSHRDAFIYRLSNAHTSIHLLCIFMSTRSCTRFTSPASRHNLPPSPPNQKLGSGRSNPGAGLIKYCVHARS